MSTTKKNIKERIHEYLESGLSEKQTDELWAYLLGNPEDLEYMETLATLKTMAAEGRFDDLSEEHEKVTVDAEDKKPAKVYYLKRILVAASLLIIGVSVIYNISSTQETIIVSPIASIEYDIERSATVANTYEQFVNNAVEMSASGNVRGAVETLDEAQSNLELSDEQKAELLILKGSFYYNYGEYEKARGIFEQVIENGSESSGFMNYEKGVWYLANTYLQLGETRKAYNMTKEVVELDGAYRRVAEQKMPHMHVR